MAQEQRSGTSSTRARGALLARVGVLGGALVVACASFSTTSCSRKPKEGVSAAATATQTAAPIATAPTKKVEPSMEIEPLEVADEGTKFDPTVPISWLPDDIWLCEIATKSHYATRTKGDGKCPVCTLMLVTQQQLADGTDPRDKSILPDPKFLPGHERCGH